MSTKHMTGFTDMYLPLVSDYSWGTKHTTGFTREYLPVVSYYSQVQKCITGVTREYFQLVSNRLWAVYSSCHMSPTCESSPKFLEAWIVTHVFCKRRCELYCMQLYNASKKSYLWLAALNYFHLEMRQFQTIKCRDSKFTKIHHRCQNTLMAVGQVFAVTDTCNYVFMYWTHALIREGSGHA